MLGFLRDADLPRMSRPNFRAERNHMALWGIVAGMVEGNTSSIVVAKTFQASELLIAVVWSTPMLANVLSLVWGELFRGRPRKGSFVLLSVLMAVSLGSVGFISPDAGPVAGWIFAMQIALARLFLAGMVNLRSGMWSLNYPTHLRGRVTGRLQSLRFLMGLMAAAAVTSLFDHESGHYRWVYPLVAVIAVAALVPLRPFRVRAERANLAAQRRAAGWGAAGGPRRGALHALRDSLARSVRVLREDAAFRRYCTAQHFLGSANFLVDPILAVVILSQLKIAYFESSLLLDLLPNIVMILALSSWSKRFDRVGVLRFRVYNGAAWLGSSVLAAAALFTLHWSGFVMPAGANDFWSASSAMPPTVWVAIAILVASRIVQGVARAGGAIAWNLGHLHFARPQDADLYMSIHVALTGIRGTIMPFLAIYAHKYLGWPSMLIAVVMGVVAWEMFRRLAKADAPRTE